jgi:hypothetical protein
MEELLILNFQYHANALLATTENSQSSSINKDILVKQKQKQLYKGSSSVREKRIVGCSNRTINIVAVESWLSE